MSVKLIGICYLKKSSQDRVSVGDVFAVGVDQGRDAIAKNVERGVDVVHLLYLHFKLLGERESII